MSDHAGSSEHGGYRPMVGFMIVGAQRCGTTALARCLSRHPQIEMSSRKEMHLFDRTDYCTSWTPQQIDAVYRTAFTKDDRALIRGEATPIYLFFPEIARELSRYNPNLKLIVLLRDPVERAISGYYLEKNRGLETKPLWLSLLLEPFRLWRCPDARAPRSFTRLYAYRRRGLYSYQLRNLLRFFHPRQVLIVRTCHLSDHHPAVMRRVFAFLGVNEQVRIGPERLNHADRSGRTHQVVSWSLRLLYMAEFARMRTLIRRNPDLNDTDARSSISGSSAQATTRTNQPSEARHLR